MSQPPLLSKLPDRLVRRLAGLLDAPAVNNWRSLAANLSFYDQTDVAAFSLQGQKARGSASLALLQDLQSRGWSAVDLAQLASISKLKLIRDILVDHCKERCPGLVFPSLHSPPPILKGGPLSAKTCYQHTHRPHTPSPPPSPSSPPPSTNHSTDCEKRPGSRHGGVGPSSSASQVSPVPSIGAVPYQLLSQATNGFAALPVKEGGCKVGEGGFGAVFRCRVPVLGREVEVAVKVLLSEDASASKEQLETEFNTLTRLSHTCLLPLLGYSWDGPRPCLLYPYMPNRSLDGHVRACQRLPPGPRLLVAQDLCSALQYLHHGTSPPVAHRDVKSANVLLDRGWRAKLGDLGLARLLPHAPSPAQDSSTHTTRMVGTLAYMAPECAQGLVSTAADMYAFGMVLFELLTAQHAQEADSGTDLLTYVEEHEERPEAVLMVGWEGLPWRNLWDLALLCVDDRHKRPTATKVLEVLMQDAHF